MSEEIDQIAAIRSQAIAQLAAVTAEPKPSYVIDGQRVDWAEYTESLQRTIDWCDQKLADHGPIEVQSWGTT